MYFTIKVKPIRDSDLGLEEIMSITETIFVNHSERSSVPKTSQESYRKVRNNSGREPTMNDRESAMTTVITCHNSKRPGHTKKGPIWLEQNRISQVISRTGKGNDAHTIKLTVIRTKTAISSSQSQQISIGRKYGVRITTALAIRMSNIFTKEAVNLKLVLLLMVQRVRNK